MGKGEAKPCLRLGTDTVWQLKETLKIVADIKAQSGFKWDEERGADIDETTAVVWEDYEKVYSLLIFSIVANKFRL